MLAKSLGPWETKTMDTDNLALEERADLQSWIENSEVQVLLWLLLLSMFTGEISIRYFGTGPFQLDDKRTNSSTTLSLHVWARCIFLDKDGQMWWSCLLGYAPSYWLNHELHGWWWCSHRTYERQKNTSQTTDVPHVKLGVGSFRSRFLEWFQSLAFRDLIYYWLRLAKDFQRW